MILAYVGDLWIVVEPDFGNITDAWIALDKCLQSQGEPYDQTFIHLYMYRTNHITCIYYDLFIGCFQKTSRETAIQWITLNVGWNQRFMVRCIASVDTVDIHNLMETLFLLEENDYSESNDSDIKYLYTLKEQITIEFDEQPHYRMVFSNGIDAEADNYIHNEGYSYHDEDEDDNNDSAGDEDIFTGVQVSEDVYHMQPPVYFKGLQVCGDIESFHEPSFPSMNNVLHSSIGIETLGGEMMMIMDRNTTLPCTKYAVFMTNIENQVSCIFKIFDGERSFAKKNIKVAEIVFGNLPSDVSTESVRIEITIMVDLNRLINMTIVEPSSGHMKNIIVGKSRYMSNEEIEIMTDVAIYNREKDDMKIN